MGAAAATDLEPTTERERKSTHQNNNTEKKKHKKKKNVLNTQYPPAIQLDVGEAS